MDRIILGKAPEIEIGTTSPTYNRQGNTGLFISKPGANVMSCSDGDLLFDSTAPDFIQVLAKGNAVIGAGDNPSGGIGGDGVFPAFPAGDQPGSLVIDTKIKSPHKDDNATIHVDWTSMVGTSNVHPNAFPDNWNTSVSDEYVVVPPYLVMDFINLEDPTQSGAVAGYSLTASTRTNPATGNVDIVFKNGSPYRGHTVAWTLYRTRGED